MKRFALILFLIVVLLAGFWVGLGVFIRSDAFRLWLGHRVSQSLGAEGSFEPLSWTGATFRSGGFKATGQPGSKIGSISLTGLTAHLDWPKLLTGQIILDAVSVDQAEAQLLPPRATRPEPVAPTSSKPPYLRFRLHFSVQRVTVAHASLAYESRHGTKGSLNNLGILAVKTGPKAWEFTVNGGTIRSDRFPATQLLKAQAGLNSRRLQIQLLELASPDGGTATIQGEIQLNRELSAELHAKLAGISVASFPLNKEKLDGVANADLTFQGALNHFERGTIQGDFRATNVHYDFRHYISSLRYLAGSGPLGSANFDSVAGHALYSNHNFLLTNLDAAYRDTVRVMGTVEVKGDQLQGVLQVGLKPELLDWVPGSLEAVFSEQRGGLNWTVVRLSGTVQEPKEDLSKRILTAVEDRLGRDLRNRLKDTAKSLRDLFKH
ncbi:MAG: hypothetical protein JOY92_15085 [Verrucomicrobia bacterium]|nr:hypothetical protein [Verrucomicrobiota bacterium]